MQYGCQMLMPPGELLGFERNKIREQKIKSSYYPQISKKLKHKIQCIKVWQGKVNFSHKNIFLYNPQRYRALNTSKKESQNGGIGS